MASAPPFWRSSTSSVPISSMSIHCCIITPLIRSASCNMACALHELHSSHVLQGLFQPRNTDLQGVSLILQLHVASPTSVQAEQSTCGSQNRLTQ